jgi:hypothetical protein
MQRMHIFVRHDQLQSLTAIPGNFGEKVRAAIDLYIKEHKQQVDAQTSPSKKGAELHG